MRRWAFLAAMIALTGLAAAWGSLTLAMAVFLMGTAYRAHAGLRRKPDGCWSCGEAPAARMGLCSHCWSSVRLCGRS